jgi:hypothetical protein
MSTNSQVAESGSPLAVLPAKRNSSAAQSRSQSPAKGQVFIWLCLVVLVVLFFLKDYGGFQVGVYSDDAHYVVLAQSIVQGGHYGLINAPGEPTTAPFPFGYPLFLTIPLLFAPGNLDALRAISLIATLANVSLLFWGWRWLGRSTYWWGLAVAGLYALSPYTTDQARMVMSEPSFTTFCLIGMVLAEQEVRGHPHWSRQLAIGAVLAFIVSVRTVGIVIVVGLLLYLLARGGRSYRKAIGLILIGVVATILVVVTVTPVGLGDLGPARYLTDKDSSPITADLTEIDTQLATQGNPLSRSSDPVSRIANWVRRAKVIAFDYILVYGIKQHIGADLRAVAFPVGGGASERAFATAIAMPFLPAVLGFFIAGLVFLGWARSVAREGLSIFVFLAVPYFFALFLWAWKGSRLLYPIAPQIYYGLLLGADALLSLLLLPVRSMLRLRLRNLGLTMVTAILLVLWSIKSMMVQDTLLHVGDLEARSSWLRANTPPSAIVMTNAPVVDFMYSRRETVPYPPSDATTAEMIAYLEGYSVSYILVAAPIKWDELASSLPQVPAAVADLQAMGIAQLVYSSATDSLQVFRVSP